MSATTMARDDGMASSVPEEDDGYLDEPDRAPSTREPSFAAGMAFCIPTLSLIGILYTLLK